MDQRRAGLWLSLPGSWVCCTSDHSGTPQPRNDLDLITTAPSWSIASTAASRTDDARATSRNPADYPDPSRIETDRRAVDQAVIYTPDEYLGSILKLCRDRRGIQTGLTYVGGRAQWINLPLNRSGLRLLRPPQKHQPRLCQLRLRTDRPARGDLVKMGILVNNETGRCPLHDRPPQRRRRTRPPYVRRAEGPPATFQIPIQAAIGGKVIARETIAALPGDVTAKCYGGDIARKKAAGSRRRAGRMREYGSVRDPAGGVIAALRMGR